MQLVIRGRSNWRDNVHSTAVAVEFDIAFNESPDRVVTTESDIAARLKFCSALPDDNVAGDDGFSAKFFHAQPFALAVATVFDTSLSFFMGHDVTRWRLI